MYLIVYVTRSCEIIYRLVKHKPYYDNHSYTSMGWYIVDIQQYYKDRFYKLEDYDKKIRHDIEKWEKTKGKRLRKKVKRFYTRRSIIRKIFKKYI